MSHLRFRSHLQVEAISADSLLLLTEQDAIYLQGRLYRALAPLLDGTRTTDEIVRALVGQFSPAEVHYGLGQLKAQGYLTEEQFQTTTPAAMAFWHSLGMEPGEVQERLQSSRVRVRALGQVRPGLVKEALKREGLRVVDSRDHLTLVLTDDYLSAPLAELNRQALRSRRPWILAKPLGRELWLGPCFLPEQSACWECLAQRLRLNQPLDVWLQPTHSRNSMSRRARSCLESTVRAAAELLAVSVACGLATGTQELTGALVTLDPLGLGMQRHIVMRRPQCSACGDAGQVAARQWRPLVLESRPKVSLDDGGHRSAEPQQLLRRLLTHVSPLTGVAQRLERSDEDGGDVAITFDAGPNPSRPGRDLDHLQRGFRSHNAGKGKTVTQARLSALAEAIERYSGIFHGEEAQRHATFKQLGEEALSPHATLLFSEAQYRSRSASHALRDLPRSRRIPHPFNPDWTISWSPAWSLSRGIQRYLPTALCYYGYQDEGLPAFGWADSNGCAAGTCLEDAILQGFLELVERDAVALWWYNRLCRPRVALDSFDEPYFRQIQEHYRRLGRELWVLELTTDLSIPSFIAVSRRVDGGPEALVFGFGAHLEPRLGILRALTEMNQLLPYARLIRQPWPPGASEAAKWMATDTLADHPHLAPDEGQPARTALDGARLWREDVHEDVETCVRLARERGLEVLVVDQTRPDVGLSVARVVVPGLRHFWRRLAPGRLYDVPVQFGWLRRPLSEHELNPRDLFF